MERVMTTNAAAGVAAMSLVQGVLSALLDKRILEIDDVLALLTHARDLCDQTADSGSEAAELLQAMLDATNAR